MDILHWLLSKLVSVSSRGFYGSGKKLTLIRIWNDIFNIYIKNQSSPLISLICIGYGKSTPCTRLSPCPDHPWALPLSLAQSTSDLLSSVLPQITRMRILFQVILKSTTCTKMTISLASKLSRLPVLRRSKPCTSFSVTVGSFGHFGGRSFSEVIFGRLLILVQFHCFDLHYLLSLTNDNLLLYVLFNFYSLF